MLCSQGCSTYFYPRLLVISSTLRGIVKELMLFMYGITQSYDSSTFVLNLVYLCSLINLTVFKYTFLLFVLPTLWSSFLHTLFLLLKNYHVTFILLLLLQQDPSEVPAVPYGSIPFSLPLIGQLLAGISDDLSGDGQCASLSGVLGALEGLMAMFLITVNIDRWW